MTCRVTLRGSQIRDEQVSVTVALYSEFCLKAYVADVSFLEKGSGHPLAQKQKDVFLHGSTRISFRCRLPAQRQLLRRLVSQRRPGPKGVDTCLFW